MRIPTEVKRECVRLAMSGMNSREVYDEYFNKQHEGMAYSSFQPQLSHWRHNAKYADEMVLADGTFPNFTAKRATVQIDGKGNITQAWVKQELDDNQYEELLEAIKEVPAQIEPDKPKVEANVLLEVPLYDLHFPLSEHTETLSRVIDLIHRRIWDETVFVIGQDLFHNDDFRGRTASGRQIERVDIPKAWRMARDFYVALIREAWRWSSKVRVVYSKGNHDESLSWAFVQMLKAMFPGMEVDDSTKQRKAIYWRECFIGITHGANAKATAQDLRGQFTIQFPQEFAMAKVREIHCGHLHHESLKDVYGVAARRLSRAGTTDEWSDDEGYVGTHKRFMCFVWEPGELKEIHYV